MNSAKAYIDWLILNKEPIQYQADLGRPYYMGSNFHVSLRNGVCSNIDTNYCAWDIPTRVSTWEHWSGSDLFPVPANLDTHSHESARYAFRRMFDDPSHGWGTSPYGQARWAYIEYLAGAV